MLMKKTLFVIIVVLPQLLLIQSCLPFNDSIGSEKSEIITMLIPTETNEFIPPQEISIPPEDVPIPERAVELEPTENYKTSSSMYNELASSFIAKAVSYSGETGRNGSETNDVFNEIKIRFLDVLATRESVLQLDQLVNSLVEEKSVFNISISEMSEIDNITYRIIELKSKHTNRTLGAFDSLFIQCWTDNEVKCYPLVETKTTSVLITSNIDYRLLSDERMVSVVQKQYNSVDRSEDSYILYLFSLNNGCVADAYIDLQSSSNNGYWEAVGREYSFYTPTRKVKGIHVFELIDGENAEKTSLKVLEKELIIYNINTPENCVELEYVNGTWQIRLAQIH